MRNSDTSIWGIIPQRAKIHNSSGYPIEYDIPLAIVRPGFQSQSIADTFEQGKTPFFHKWAGCRYCIENINILLPM